MYKTASFSLIDGVLQKDVETEEYIDAIYVRYDDITVNRYFDNVYILLSDTKIDNKVIMDIELQTCDEEIITRSPYFHHKELHNLIAELVCELKYIDDKSDDQMIIDYFNDVMKRIEILGRYLYYRHNELEDELSSMNLSRPCKSAR